MKDLLLFIPVDDFAAAQYEFIPLGVLCLSSFLSKAGYEVDVIHGRIGDVKSGYKAYGLSAATAHYTPVQKVLKKIRKIEPNAKIIGGGPHFKSKGCIEDALKDDWDHLVSGDGEYALLDILSGKTNDKVVYGAPIMDLDSLPFPDWDKIDINKYSFPLGDGLRCVNIFTSRGCPFNCQYCGSAKTKLRERSPEKILEEVDILVNKYGFNSLMFADDTMSMNKKRFYSILSGLEEYDLKWRSLIRASTIADDGLERMKRSGCVELGPGIESGNQKMLDLIKKKSKVEDNIRFVRRCEEVGITCVPSLIIGLPNECLETINDNYEFIKKSKPSAFAWNIFFPFPDSPIFIEKDTTYKDSITIYPYSWDDCVTKSKKIERCFVSTPYLSREQILEEYHRIYNLFAEMTGFDPRKRGTRGEENE